MHQNDDFITMGKIVNAFGIKGWVKIKAENPESLSKNSKLNLFINKVWSEYIVEKSFIQNDILHIKFKEINDRDTALTLKGTIIGNKRSEFPNLENGEYYWVDLIGLNVYNRQDQFLGTVDSLMETGATSVLVVKNHETQHLIPFVGIYVIDVDLNNKRILVDWGLDY